MVLQAIVIYFLLNTTVYQVGSISFMALACMELLKAGVVAGYYSEIYKSYPQINFLVNTIIFLVSLCASFIIYRLQYLYTIAISKSQTTQFLGAVFWCVIKKSIYPKLYVISYEIMLAYAFQETSIILQYVFTARAMGNEEPERFFVVKAVIFHAITFVYEDLMAANYVQAATMTIPIIVGLLALLEKENWIILRDWINGVKNDFVEYVLQAAIANENGGAVLTGQ